MKRVLPQHFVVCSPTRKLVCCVMLVVYKLSAVFARGTSDFWPLRAVKEIIRSSNFKFNFNSFSFRRILKSTFGRNLLFL